MAYTVYSATLEYATASKTDTYTFQSKYLVVKFIGSLEHQKGLTCISSNWLNSTLDRIVFVRYPPPNKRENMLLYLKENFPVFVHWQTYLATVYYQTDNLRDALLYTAHYTSPNEVKSKLIPKTTTNIKNIVVNESFFDLSAAIKVLTVMEQFMIIRPLIVSILQSIDMFRERYRSQLQARPKGWLPGGDFHFGFDVMC
ncbi:hypothetical protein MTR_0287s0070 [Medicago truncatula]|uniref:Uncharacterized protein n=1 Tax=Medicago truncatula TaxID=3880 RepID=A0A072TFM4_MEDTR|nr:hypothetical protein MTR_0287s0070 [Medicago truncatula]